jgi:hypothetical protein
VLTIRFRPASEA